MIDHVGLKVSSFEKSRRFYARALEPLGFSTEYDDPKSRTAGFGAKGSSYLWVTEGEPVTRTHIALRSRDRTTVDRFHALALTAGGTDNGAPGLRPDYGPTYYAAFVLDPDGNNVELVCHE